MMSDVPIHLLSLFYLLILHLQLENENHQLRARLEQAEHTVAEMAHQMELQKTSCRQLIAGWKLKLQEGEEKLTAHSSEKDTQLSNLLSQLMYFEGNLKRERAGIEEEMNRKNARIQELDKTVKHQQKQIDALNRANERLLTSLHQTLEVNNHHSPDDDSESEETSSDSSHDSCPSSSGTPTTFNPIPLVARSRKVSMPALMSNGMPPPSMMNHHRRHRPSRPVSVLQQKQRQNLVANGGLSSPASSSPDAPRRRVRFGPDVETSTKDEEVAEDTDSDNEMKKRGRLRKISLPAYRLPTDEEGSIRYF